MFEVFYIGYKFSLIWSPKNVLARICSKDIAILKHWQKFHLKSAIGEICHLLTELSSPSYYLVLPKNCFFAVHHM